MGILLNKSPWTSVIYWVKHFIFLFYFVLHVYLPYVGVCWTWICLLKWQIVDDVQAYPTEHSCLLVYPSKCGVVTAKGKAESKQMKNTSQVCSSLCQPHVSTAHWLTQAIQSIGQGKYSSRRNGASPLSEHMMESNLIFHINPWTAPNYTGIAFNLSDTFKFINAHSHHLCTSRI